MRFQIRPKLRSKLPALLAVATLAAALPAQSDELTTPPAPSASTNVPARGTSMEKVEAQFGAPSNRVAPVGQPPITRWEYPGFVVFFENQLVIHAVAIG